MRCNHMSRERDHMTQEVQLHVLIKRVFTYLTYLRHNVTSQHTAASWRQTVGLVPRLKYLEPKSAEVTRVVSPNR